MNLLLSNQDRWVIDDALKEFDKSGEVVNNAENLMRVVKSMRDTINNIDKESIFGDGYYDGFKAAQAINEKDGELLEEYKLDAILSLSEDAEGVSKYEQSDKIKMEMDIMSVVVDECDTKPRGNIVDIIGSSGIKIYKYADYFDGMGILSCGISQRTHKNLNALPDGQLFEPKLNRKSKPWSRAKNKRNNYVNPRRKK